MSVPSLDPDQYFPYFPLIVALDTSITHRLVVSGSYRDSTSQQMCKTYGTCIRDNLILNERQRGTASVVDHFVDEFQIKSDPLLTNDRRSSTTVAGFPGEQITWSDTLAGQSDFEFTVIKVQDEPYDAFVTFNFSDEDISKNEVHKANFVQSIHLD